MSNKSLDQQIIINDILAPDDDDDDNKYGTKTPLSKPARRLRRKTQTKVIQHWVKQNKDDFKQTEQLISQNIMSASNEEVDLNGDAQAQEELEKIVQRYKR